MDSSQARLWQRTRRSFPGHSGERQCFRDEILSESFRVQLKKTERLGLQLRKKQKIIDLQRKGSKLWNNSWRMPKLKVFQVMQSGWNVSLRSSRSGDNSPCLVRLRSTAQPPWKPAFGGQIYTRIHLKWWPPHTRLRKARKTLISWWMRAAKLLTSKPPSKLQYASWV